MDEECGGLLCIIIKLCPKSYLCAVDNQLKNSILTLQFSFSPARIPTTVGLKSLLLFRPENVVQAFMAHSVSLAQGYLEIHVLAMEFAWMAPMALGLVSVKQDLKEWPVSNVLKENMAPTVIKVVLASGSFTLLSFQVIAITVIATYITNYATPVLSLLFLVDHNEFQRDFLGVQFNKIHMQPSD